MAGLGEVCSHVGAILFYIEALRCAKTCTDVTCQWVVPTSVKSIPYAKIADIDFTQPKSKIAPLKQAAHHNNDCDMLSGETDIENALLVMVILALYQPPILVARLMLI